MRDYVETFSGVFCSVLLYTPIDHRSDIKMLNTLWWSHDCNWHTVMSRIPNPVTLTQKVCSIQSIVMGISGIPLCVHANSISNLTPILLYPETQASNKEFPVTVNKQWKFWFGDGSLEVGEWMEVLVLELKDAISRLVDYSSESKPRIEWS